MENNIFCTFCKFCMALKMNLFQFFLSFVDHDVCLVRSELNVTQPPFEDKCYILNDKL